MNINRTYLAIIGILTIFGCSTKPESTTATKTSTKVVVSDRLVSMFAGKEFSGYWKGNQFAGEFFKLKFEPVLDKNGQWLIENGQPVCTISGAGEIWRTPKSIAFTATGRSIGRSFDVTLQTDSSPVIGKGSIEEVGLLDVRCKVVFNYGNQDHTVWLDIVNDIETARASYFASQTEQDK